MVTAEGKSEDHKSLKLIIWKYKIFAPNFKIRPSGGASSKAKG